MHRQGLCEWGNQAKDWVNLKTRKWRQYQSITRHRDEVSETQYGPVPLSRYFRFSHLYACWSHFFQVQISRLSPLMPLLLDEGARAESALLIMVHGLLKQQNINEKFEELYHSLLIVVSDDAEEMQKYVSDSRHALVSRRSSPWQRNRRSSCFQSVTLLYPLAKKKSTLCAYTLTFLKAALLSFFLLINHL